MTAPGPLTVRTDASTDCPEILPNPSTSSSSDDFAIALRAADAAVLAEETALRVHSGAGEEVGAVEKPTDRSG
jgi:hypothetical protein